MVYLTDNCNYSLFLSEGLCIHTPGDYSLYEVFTVVFKLCLCPSPLKLGQEYFYLQSHQIFSSNNATVMVQVF